MDETEQLGRATRYPADLGVACRATCVGRRGCALSLAETFDSGSKWERMDASGFWSGKVGEADNEVPAWTKGGLLGKGSFGKVHLGLGPTPGVPRRPR